MNLLPKNKVLEYFHFTIVILYKNLVSLKSILVHDEVLCRNFDLIKSKICKDILINLSHINKNEDRITQENVCWKIDFFFLFFIAYINRIKIQVYELIQKWALLNKC